MITLVGGIITIMMGLSGLFSGFYYDNLIMLVTGGSIAILGMIFVIGTTIAIAIEEAGNKNISALNEIIVGLSD